MEREHAGRAAANLWTLACKEVLFRDLASKIKEGSNIYWAPINCVPGIFLGTLLIGPCAFHHLHGKSVNSPEPVSSSAVMALPPKALSPHSHLPRPAISPSLHWDPGCLEWTRSASRFLIIFIYACFSSLTSDMLSKSASLIPIFLSRMSSNITSELALPPQPISFLKSRNIYIDCYLLQKLSSMSTSRSIESQSIMFKFF